jgi:hypothetical protein
MSNVNPYLAPQTPEPPHQPNVGPSAPGQPLHWEVGEVLNQAWALFKPSWGALVGSLFVSQFIGAMLRSVFNVPISLGQVTPQDDAYWPLVGVSTLLGMVIQQFFQVGLTRIWLSVARGQTPTFTDVFNGWSRFFPMLGVFFITFLLALVGMCFFIVPGVIVGVGLMLAPWYVVDKNMGVMEALKTSWKATTGSKGKLFGFTIAIMGVIILGYLACCIGVLGALPVAQVAVAIVYLRMTGQASYDPSAPSAYNQPPPGGYGPPPPGYGPPPPGGFGG